MKNQDKLLQILKKTYRTAQGMFPDETALLSAAQLLLAKGAEKRRLTCEEITEVWKICILPPDSQAPADDWLLHCYRYLRNNLFPHLDPPEDASAFTSQRDSLLRFLRAVFEFERNTLPFDPRMDMLLLSDQQIRSAGYNEEYLQMKKLAQDYYVYEFMRIGRDITPFNTLGHVSGVHYVAMYTAEQLAQTGVPLDLGLVSAASACHDIGKYGCRKMEEGRVPYLHYYYTDYCLNRGGLATIAHIAANHSTWDLELENLSAESLLLIYADFRTKSSRDAEGREAIHFYNLAEAFQVILDKLDNVDEAKRHRYIRVYNKLKDFEDYMVEHGVDTIIEDNAPTYPEHCLRSPVPVERETVLLSGMELVNQMKYQAMDHNIRLMSRFNSAEDFGSLLEAARSETDWKNVRTYINILQEYSTYMTEEQKLMTLSFLYEMLPHPQSDIRLQAARVMGRIVARFREEYKKELPEDVPAADITTTNVELFARTLRSMFQPDHKYTEQHRKWILQRMDEFVKATIENCRPSCRPKYFDVLEVYYSARQTDEETVIELMSTALLIPEELAPEQFPPLIRAFADRITGRFGLRADLITVNVLRHFHLIDPDEADLKERQLLGLPAGSLTDDHLSGIFLDDLKTHVSWNVKVANISVLLEAAKETTQKNRLLHIATHFSNLIKVSETVTVRQHAGRALLQIIGDLSPDQRNEIMIELFNGLEIDDYQFTRFIPDYLGIVLLYLPAEEVDEVIDQLHKMLSTGSERASTAALNTAAILLKNYGSYQYEQTEEAETQRILQLLGVLMKGFSYYKRQISREAFRNIGEHLFAGTGLTLDEKHRIAARSFKRILTLLPEVSEENALEFYNNAAVLNQIYRFISDYQSEVGSFDFPSKQQVAFFPGTFDPFSLGHKAIASTIRDQGFEVYLAIDEFSWSKKTLPHMLRRNILSMSIADEEDLYIFPDDISVNIANPDDLRTLRHLFADKELYIAIGTDVLMNASCYKKTPEENSIHSFNHIVFARESKKLDEDGEGYPVKGRIIRLSLEKYYEDISSTRIRENIDLGRDISNLIDPVAQNYIYDRNYYSREPAYKHELQAKNMQIHSLMPGQDLDLSPLRQKLAQLDYDCGALSDYLNRPDIRRVAIDTGSRAQRLAAFAGAHQVETQDLLEEFGDLAIASHIRRSSGGKIAVIGAFQAFRAQGVSNLRQILLTELLTELLASDCAYATYHPVCEAGLNPKTMEALRKQGFVDISHDPVRPVLAVDMREPIIIFRDAETVVKAPLNKDPKVQKALDTAHDRLLDTLRSIYPGRLILSFNTSAVYSRIISLVARDNGVSTQTDPLRRRGPYLSVPFGKALSDVVVPNTVTKALHTEKFYYNDLSGFSIRHAREYQTLDDQVTMLKSFDREVILVDDLLHSGQRMTHIDPILRKHDVKVHKIIVGLLTGNAKDEMAMRRRDVEGAYFIPSISLWINERDCYPFIGGDSIEPAGTETGSTPRNESINLILPYTGMGPIGETPEQFRQYSLTCLENAALILRTLEQQYQAAFEKKLTIRRLGAVISNPCQPLLGEGLIYDEHIAPSTYIENEIRKVGRLHTVRSENPHR